MASIKHETRSPDARGPAVSIVMPVFNGERYLREAIGSVLAQTFTEFELIAVDDCSTDSTSAILAEYAERDSRITVVRNPHNLKLPASLNAGFARATGQWFSWTSDDNVQLPGMLSRLLAEAQSNPDADIIYSDYRIIDADGARRARVAAGPKERLVVDNVVGCSFLYRREVDRRIGGYDADLFGLEDYDFWLRAAKAGFTFHPVAAELYLYRRHEGSLTDTRARRIRDMIARVLPEHIAALPPSPLRAEAQLRLATRDPFTFRWRAVLAALRDDAGTVMGNGRDIVAWMKASVRIRLGL